MGRMDLQSPLIDRTHIDQVSSDVDEDTQPANR
jgi:hypothetical protein